MGNKILLFVLCLLGEVSFSKADPLPNWINKVVYIDPNFIGASDGSLAKPYSKLDFKLSNKTAYLFKRNTTLVISDYLFNCDSIYIGDYSTGSKPLISLTTSFEILGRGNIVHNLKLISKDTLRTTTLSVNSSDSWVVVDSCVIDKGFRGIGGAGDSVVFKNCVVSNSFQDGGYFSNCDSVYILNCHVYDVNVGWNYSHTVNIGGDGIQFETGNGMVYVDNCILDHSRYGGKFALISNGSDTTIVKNTTLIGNQTFSGENAVVYIGSNNKTAIHKGFSFTNCKIIGGKYGLWGHATTNVYNCMFWGQTTYGVYQNNFRIYNSLFRDIPYACHLYGGTLISQNNIFYNVGSTYGYNAGDNLTISHNLYFNPAGSEFGNLSIPMLAETDPSTSFNVDPNFLYPTGTDYRLASKSPIIGKGTAVAGLNFDIENFPRMGNVDIGPYQYQPSMATEFMTTRIEDKYERIGNGCSVALEDYSNEMTVINATGTVTITQKPLPGFLVELKNKSQLVTLIANDGNNADTTQFTVFIYDGTLPVITKKAPDINAIKQLNAYILPDMRSSIEVTDNCNTDLFFFQEPVPGTPYNSEDTIQVSIGVTDGNGNIAYDTAYVYLTDQINWTAFTSVDSVMINLGTTSTEAPSPWVPTAGEALNLNLDGKQIRFELLSGNFNNIPSLWGELCNNENWGIVGRSLIYSTSDTSKLLFSNLDTSAYYKLSIFGRSTHYPYTDITFYDVNGTSDFIETGLKTQKIIKLKGLKAESNGNMILKMSKGSPEDFYTYINGVIIYKDKLTGSLLKPIKLYPNPANDYVTIEFNELTTKTKLIDIYDINGRRMIEKKIEAGVTKETISIMNLQSGLYFISLNQENKRIWLEKFIKIK